MLPTSEQFSIDGKEQVEISGQTWLVTFPGDYQEKKLPTARQFLKQLKQPDQQFIRDLVVTPILLNLIYLVFKAKGELPTERHQLYEKGLELLLLQWNPSQSIPGDEVYQNLSLEQKLELFMQISAITFEKNLYFFEERKVQQCIFNYLITLPNAESNHLKLLQDSKAVLKAIEVQHGLIVERVRGIYSFSHLSFQEYFAARAIVRNFAAINGDAFLKFINHPNWREVFLMAAQMTEDADGFLGLMKQRIDQLLARDEQLQYLLNWVHQKANSVKVPYRKSAIKAFYLSHIIEFVLEYKNSVIDFSHAVDRAFKASFYEDCLMFKLDDNLKKTVDKNYLNSGFNLDIILDCFLLTSGYDFEIFIDFARTRKIIFNSKLRKCFDKIRTYLPDAKKEQIKYWKWWKKHGKSCLEKLREIIVKCYDIGQDWDFDGEQQKLLRQYYDANQLLIECMQVSHVSFQVQENLENQLFLPIAHLQN